MATLAKVWFISILQILQSALGSAICDTNRNLLNSTKACLPLCSEELARASSLYFSVPDQHLKLNISNGVTQTDVNLFDSFHFWNVATCSLPPYYEHSQNFTVFENGSISLHNHDTTYPDAEQDYHVCITANNALPVVIICTPAEDDVEIISRLYSAFFAISVVFLAFTLIAFLIAPEMKNIQGKSIACQSAYLMIAYVALILSHLRLTTEDLVFCKILVYITHMSLLGSFFWLHTMCFDIFWTFSDFAKMTGSLHQTHKKKFRIYAVYATAAPATLSLVLIILDNSLNETYLLYPNISIDRCWFAEKSIEFLYLQGPIVLILLQNIAFFLITFYKIYKMKSESKVLKRGDSMTHNGETTDSSNRKRLMLYVKLFILMGGTWLLEVLSWAIEGSMWVWLVPDILNCLRGVLIFFICVWSNTQVKKSLLRRIGFINTQNSSVKSRSSNSKVSDVTHSPNDSASPALQQTMQEEVVNLMENVEQQEHSV